MGLSRNLFFKFAHDILLPSIRKANNDAINNEAKGTYIMNAKLTIAGVPILLRYGHK